MAMYTKSVIVDVIFMIVRCDENENYVSYKDASGWIVIWGSSQELYIPNRYKVEQPDALQHNEMTNSKTEKCLWKQGVLLRELPLKMGSAPH